MGGESAERADTHTHTYMYNFTVHLKLTEHCTYQPHQYKIKINFKF